ncbi:hypothetical protein N7G274_003952 [Stereocaulon virgatum]|uniref:Proteinase inhibitor I78 n=1 Tax=Stereocaulon virgatum TaxID=373712 RepID=A0ABR4ADU8_9LECA
MPLVVPGMMGGSGNQQQEWMNKLVGKTITDGNSDATSFAKQDLPKEHRVLKPGAITTQDFKPDRMNIHLAEDGTVRHVDFK